MSISNLFILSLRGDTIINRDFSKSIKKGINEVFFRKVNCTDEGEDTTPPVFNIEGVNFIYIKTNDLYFCLTTLDNPSPAYFLEILHRLMSVIKDHCGVLSEESIRKNFVLIYEIIDEMIDFGFPQMCSTDEIKPFVFTECVLVKDQKKIIDSANSVLRKNTKPADITVTPISKTDKANNELYVDLFEKISCLFNSNGNLINSSIDGFIKFKNYLKNKPEIKLSLSDEITLGKISSYSSGIQIDDCNFHQCVNPRDFMSQKTLLITPPDGEFVAMNYRITTDFAPPFKFYTYTEETPYKLEIKIKVQANFSEKFTASNVICRFNVPKTTQNVYFDLQGKKIGQKAEFSTNEKCCYWKINKFQGGNEFTLITKITVSNSKSEEVRKELGPISIDFEIPNFNLSKMQIKELKILTNDKNYKALKWVRVVTQANSYVARIS